MAPDGTAAVDRISSRSIVKLSDWGLNISSETAKYLVKYLQQMEAMNQDRIPLCYSVSRLGWRKHCEEFILPSNTDYRIEMDDEGILRKPCRRPENCHAGISWPGKSGSIPSPGSLWQHPSRRLYWDCSASGISFCIFGVRPAVGRRLP